MNPTLKTSIMACAMGLSATGAFAAATATDTAANYAGNWSTSPANLGSGFGAWNITDDNAGPPYSGTYLDQTSYGNSDGVLSSGYAWGTYANSGSAAYINMMRPFTAGPSGSTSLYNQTFSIDLGTSGIGGAGSVLGVNIGSAFSVGYAGGGGDNMYYTVDGSAASALPVNYAELNAGLQVSLAVSGPLNSTSEAYTLTLAPAAGGAPFAVETGTFNSAAYDTASFTAFDANTSNDGFFNNPNITAEAVPEPSTLALIAVNGGAALAYFRRRK